MNGDENKSSKLERKKSSGLLRQATDETVMFNKTIDWLDDEELTDTMAFAPTMKFLPSGEVLRWLINRVYSIEKTNMGEKKESIF